MAAVSGDHAKLERMQRTTSLLGEAVDSPQFDTRALKLQTHQKTRIKSEVFAALAAEAVFERDIAMSVLRLDRLDYDDLTAGITNERFNFNHELLLAANEVLSSTKEA